MKLIFALLVLLPVVVFGKKGCKSVDVYFSFELSSWARQKFFNQGLDVAKKIIHGLDVGTGAGQVRYVLGLHARSMTKRITIKPPGLKDRVWVEQKFGDSVVDQMLDDHVVYDKTFTTAAADLNLARRKATKFLEATTSSEKDSIVVIFGNGVNIGHAPVQFGDEYTLFVQEDGKNRYSENNMQRLTYYTPGNIVYAQNGAKAADQINKRIDEISCTYY